MSTKLVSFLHFQVLFPVEYVDQIGLLFELSSSLSSSVGVDHPLNILSGLLCQAAAKGV